jgi:F-type H+-transporting ATPase subunit a
VLGGSGADAAVTAPELTGVLVAAETEGVQYGAHGEILAGGGGGVGILKPSQDHIIEVPVTYLGEGFWKLNSTGVSVLAVGALLIVLAILMVRRRSLVPRGIQNFGEWLVELFERQVVMTIGEKGVGYAPFIAAIFLTILGSNLLEIVFLKEIYLTPVLPLRPPTADINVPAGMALIVFATTIIYYPIRFKGLGGYLREFWDIKPRFLILIWPIMKVLEEVAKPLSLTFRLFGNIFGGSILGALTFLFMGNLLLNWAQVIPLLIFPVAMILPMLWAALELLVGVIQALVFATLSMAYLKMAMEHH